MRAEPLACCILVAAILGAGTAVAGQSRADVALEGGGLSVDAPAAVELPAATVDRDPVTVSAPLGPLRVTDTRHEAPGWTLVAQAARPVDPRGHRIGAPLEIVPRRPTGAGAAALVLGRAGALDAPRAIISAPAGSGAGRVEVEPVLRLTVPSDAPSATYTTTLVVTVS